jgi:hypothetical protein
MNSGSILQVRPELASAVARAGRSGGAVGGVPEAGVLSDFTDDIGNVDLRLRAQTLLLTDRSVTANGGVPRRKRQRSSSAKHAQEPRTYLIDQLFRVKGKTEEIVA